jgi:ferrous iron transport protein B
LIELPEYKRPNLRSIRIYVWNKVKDYLTKAGTTIFIASIIVWFALNIGPTGFVGEPADSFAAIVAKVIAPALKPCGLNMWEVVVALFAGVSAKEVVVTSFTVLFSNAVNGASLYDSIKSVYPSFTAANALALMVFCLLYTPCLATIATIKKESESIKFTLLSMLFQIGVAFAMSTLIFNIAKLFVG